MNKLIKKLKIHIYADGADHKEIRKFNKLKFVKGFTTNPSLMKNSNVDNYKTFAKKVLKIIKNKPVSFEIFADDHDEILNSEKGLLKWLELLHYKGIAIVKNTPVKKESAFPVLNRISHTRQTFFNTPFEVINIPKPNN